MPGSPPPFAAPWSVVLPLRLRSVPNLREHWSVKSRRVKAERQAVAWVLGNGARPVLPVVVTLTRIAPRALDGDNLQGAFKGVRDQVATFLGVPDNDARVSWVYAQRRAGTRVYAVEIVIGGTNVEAT